MKLIRYALIVINTLMMQSCFEGCSETYEPEKDITVTCKNGYSEAVYTFARMTTQQLTPKDLPIEFIPNIVENGGMPPGYSSCSELTNHMFIRTPYVTFIFWRESTLKEFSKEEIIKYDIYDDIYHLTYNDLGLFNYEVVYHGYSYWQENNLTVE